jgi:hypothetical protein
MAGAKSIEAARAFVSVAWDDSAIRRGIERTKAMLNGAAAGIGKMGAGFAAAGASIIAPLTAAVFQFSEAGSAIDDMSQRTGASAESLSALSYAAQQSGTSMEAVEKGMRKLGQTATAAADGSQSAKDALAAVGLTAAKLKGLTPDQQLRTVAEMLSKITDPGKRAARAMDILGKSGAELLPMMNDGAQGITDMMKKADELGLVMSGDQAKSAAAFGDAWDETKATLSAITTQIGGALAPALTDLLGKATPMIAMVSKWIRENSAVIKTIALIGVALSVAGTALGIFSGGLTAVAFVLGALTSPLGIVIALTAAAGIAFVKMAGGIDGAIQMLKDAFPGLSESASDFFSAFKALLDAGEYSKLAEMLWLSLKLAWLSGIDALNREWLIWKDAFLSTFENAASVVRKKWSELQNMLSKGVVSVMAFFDSSIDTEAVGAELDSMMQDQLRQIDQESQANQRERESKFETDVSKVNQDLEAARAAWQDAVNQAVKIGEDKANDPSAATVADDKFTKLIEDLQAGDIATRINADVAASSTKAAQDVRSVSGAGQLTNLINRAGDVGRAQLAVMKQVERHVAFLERAIQPQVVNI